MTEKIFLLMLSATTGIFFAIGTSIVILGQSFLQGIVDSFSNVSFSNESSLLQLVSNYKQED